MHNRRIYTGLLLKLFTGLYSAQGFWGGGSQSNNSEMPFLCSVAMENLSVGYHVACLKTMRSLQPQLGEGQCLKLSLL